MDRQAAGVRALGAAEPPRGPPLPSAREAPPSPGVSAAARSGPGREVAGLAGRARRGGVGGRGAAGAPFGRALALETAGPRRPRAWGLGGTSGGGGAGWPSRGRLCVLAEWEVMLTTESWGPLPGAWAGAR